MSWNNIWSLYFAINMTKSTVFDVSKKVQLGHTPTPSNHTWSKKTKRWDFNFGSLWLIMVQFSNLMFIDMFNYVHMDEKWFYLLKKFERYFPEEEESNPYRSCKSKSFITNYVFDNYCTSWIWRWWGWVVFGGKIIVKDQ